MANFIGKGILAQYSQEIKLKKPLIVRNVGRLLKLPKELCSNLIVVRGSRKLNDDELIQNEDEIYLYFAAMGG
jgi:hypothetical protein